MSGFIRNFITGYLIVMNLSGFMVMGIDKRRAIRKGWRIRERTLLLIAFLGGGAGAFLGMMIFRHKTRHLKFVVLLPLSALLCTITVYLLFM